MSIPLHLQRNPNSPIYKYENPPAPTPGQGTNAVADTKEQPMPGAVKKTRVAGDPSIVRQLVTGAAIAGGSMLFGTDPITAIGQGIGGAAMGGMLHGKARELGNLAEDAYAKSLVKTTGLVNQKDIDMMPNVNSAGRTMVGAAATGAGILGGGLVGGLVNGITNNIITSTGSSSNQQALDPATLQSAAQAQQRSLQKAQQDQQLATFYLQSLGVLQ